MIIFIIQIRNALSTSLETDLLLLTTNNDKTGSFHVRPLTPSSTTLNVR